MIPISKSETPLVFDALPAVKVQHYCGTSRHGNIYTYMRLYALNDALALSLCTFEREPERNSRIGFSLATRPGNSLFIALSTKAAFAFEYDGMSEELPPSMFEAGAAQLSPSYYKGEDEQGWYWGAHLMLDRPLLNSAGCLLGVGNRFRAAVYKYNTQEEAYGSSFPSQGHPFDYAAMDKFEIVSY